MPFWAHPDEETCGVAKAGRPKTEKNMERTVLLREVLKQQMEDPTNYIDHQEHVLHYLFGKQLML